MISLISSVMNNKFSLHLILGNRMSTCIFLYNCIFSISALTSYLCNCVSFSLNLFIDFSVYLFCVCVYPFPLCNLFTPLPPIAVTCRSWERSVWNCSGPHCCYKSCWQFDFHTWSCKGCCKETWTVGNFCSKVGAWFPFCYSFPFLQSLMSDFVL